MSDLLSSLSKNTMPVALYSSEQIYAMEKAWFAQGYDSFALMQQAAWQVAQHIRTLYEQKYRSTDAASKTVCHEENHQPSAIIWVGKGNNGGDGWLVAHYLKQADWQVRVITVGLDMDNLAVDSNTIVSMTDAIKARQITMDSDIETVRFEDSGSKNNGFKDISHSKHYRAEADVYIDALFAIGLDRAPAGVYKRAIQAFNHYSRHYHALSIAIDIPSGLIASTGQVFDRCAIEADVTLCLIARKLGLHIKDGMDHSGTVFDIPLIPYADIEPAALMLTRPYKVSKRRQNSYKGSYGHVLIVGGNRIDGSQGMGGAAILSAASTMATGAGKITVACHSAFHGALLTSLPDAMTLDLHDKNSAESLINDASVLAIGMGLGRDKKAEDLFIYYLQTTMSQDIPIVIDADGLYHLASLQADNHELIAQLRRYSTAHKVCLTPHSGEMARLLDKDVKEVESNRLAAIKQAASIYGGDWVLKGAGSMVLEDEQIYVCTTGNAGMASAGMGDVLSGVAAGLLAQQDLSKLSQHLRQAVLIHGSAGDVLVNELFSNDALLIGERGLQAQDMPAAIRHVIHTLTR
ncbi:NAD(P)H-hydrate dehydratase [Psychrobacter sp. T6-1]|uniref:NAD(P)H-hydrate dehydratase n=1 Tax=Psychrobacter sp. T6-1 TaxID=3457447 RepID=UPI003FD63118